MTTSIPAPNDYLPPATTITPGSVLVWPPVHWLPAQLRLIRPRPDKEAGPATVQWAQPADAFFRYADQAESVAAIAKRRPCLVLATADELVGPAPALAGRMIRVVPFYTASSSYIAAHAQAISDGKFLRMMALPPPPWPHKDNVLDFKATCMVPGTHLLSATQVGRLSVDLYKAVRAAFALYITSDQTTLP